MSATPPRPANSEYPVTSPEILAESVRHHIGSKWGVEKETTYHDDGVAVALVTDTAADSYDVG